LDLLQVEHIYKDDQQNKLLDVVISEDLVNKKLVGLVANKAPGVDELVSNVFFNTADSINLPLYLTFQRSLNSGEIPADWKKANICAIFKKGPKDKCENNRPVSLTTQACKILETFIRDALCKHLELHELIRRSTTWFYFWKFGKCCLTNLLEFVNFISKHVD